MPAVKPLFGTPLNLTHPLSKGLVGCWLLNEMSGIIAYDSSGLGNHGTLTLMSNPPISTSGWSSGLNGGAVTFNGSSNYIQVNTPRFAITTDFTVHLRVKMIANAEATTRLVCLRGATGDALDLSVDTPTGLAQLYLKGTNTSGQGGYTNAQDNVWHAIAVQKQLTTQRFYFDARRDVQSESGAGTFNFTANMRFGALGWLSQQYLNGQISDVMIWNRALTAQEISYLYSQPYAMFDTDSNYAFDPSQSNTIITSGRLPL